METNYMYQKNPLLQESCKKKQKSSKKKTFNKTSKDKHTLYDVLKKNKLI